MSDSCGILVAQDSTSSDTPDGKQLYMQSCSACHQAEGQGLTNLAPALKDNPIVSGDSTQLIQIVLKGPAAVLPANRPHYGSSTMDSFYYKLSDDQIAAILTYARHEFSPKSPAPAVETKDVAAVRAKIDPQTLNF